MTYAVALAVAPCLAVGREAAARPRPVVRVEHGDDGLVALAVSVEMTVTRSTAASGTETEYHMLRKPIAPVHDGSGSASSGPVVASPQSVAWTRMSWDTESDVQLSVPTSCALVGRSFAGRRRLRRRGRHEARTSDRKQSHESDGRASGHMRIPSGGNCTSPGGRRAPAAAVTDSEA